MILFLMTLSSPVSPPNTYSVVSEFTAMCFELFKKKPTISILTWLLDKQDFRLVACRRQASLRDKPRTRR